MKKITMLSCILMLFFGMVPVGLGAIIVIGDGILYDDFSQLYWFSDVSYFANMSYEEQLLEIAYLNQANPMYTWRLATRAEVQALTINDIREYFVSPPRYTWALPYLYHEYLGYTTDITGYDAIGLYSNDEINWNWIFWEVGNRIAYEHIGAWVVSEERLLEISIDIKPWSFPNSIKVKSKGKVPVAILTTDDFDAYDVDPVSCEFAGAYPVRWNMEDVDSDGDHDILLHFMTQELDLTEDSTEVTLEGETYDGIHISGTDSVNIVPKSK